MTVEVSIARIEEQLLQQSKDIKNLQDMHSTLIEQSGLLRELTIELKHTNDALGKQDIRLVALEETPRRKIYDVWKALVGAIAGALASGLLTYFLMR